MGNAIAVGVSYLSVDLFIYIPNNTLKLSSATRSCMGPSESLHNRDNSESRNMVGAHFNIAV